MHDFPVTKRAVLSWLARLTAASVLPASAVAQETTALRAHLGGPFRLTSHRGETLTEKDLLGHPTVIFFGFTHCPEICPTTLWEVSSDMEALGDAVRDLRVYFVTVDPERDRPDILASYISSFGERITALSGTPEETVMMARNYKVVYRKVPTSDGEYTMEHTALLYLIDAGGRFFDTVRYQEDAEIRRVRLLELVRQPT